MEKSASRRRFLQDMTALGAASGVSAALGATSAAAEQSLTLAQAQPVSPPAQNTRNLPRIQLMIGPGTLPSVGKDRMDLLRYRLSGKPRLLTLALTRTSSSECSTSIERSVGTRPLLLIGILIDGRRVGGSLRLSQCRLHLS
jgi:hypothetical protein